MPSPGTKSGFCGPPTRSRLTSMMPSCARTLCEWAPGVISMWESWRGIARIAHVDDGCAVGRLHVAEIGDRSLDADLPAAGAVEPRDLLNTLRACHLTVSPLYPLG